MKCYSLSWMIYIMIKKVNDLKRKKIILQDLAYLIWCSIHSRAGKAKGYEDVTICNDWYLFSNFYKWYRDNYVKDWHVDKDILLQGNREYSPQNCIMVPRVINNLFKRSSSMHDIKGVYLDKRTDKYYAQIRIDGKTKQSGSSSDILVAHQHYLTLRKNRLEELLERFSNCENQYAYNRLVQAIQQYL